MPSGPTGEHLFIIMAGPSPLENYGSVNQFISVSVTSVYPGVPFDEACVLQPGEHSFIKHQSYVAYRHARVDTQQHLEKMVADSVWNPQEPCSVALFQKIISREIRALLG